jgi:hypothetical protein
MQSRHVSSSCARLKLLLACGLFKTPPQVIQPVVQLSLLLRRDLREGHAHAKPATVVSNFAENLEHPVVMGKAKTNARTLRDGIQHVDVAAHAADIRSARTEPSPRGSSITSGASTIGYRCAPRQRPDDPISFSRLGGEPCNII